MRPPGSRHGWSHSNLRLRKLDRRLYALHLTARGTKKLQAVGQVIRQHQDALCAALNGSERETLADLLSRIAEEQQLRPGIHPGYRRLGGRAAHEK